MRRLPALLVLLLVWTGTAQARSWSIRDFHTDLQVNRDGSLDVWERIEFAFEGSWNGIIRKIPIRYADAAGGTYVLRMKLRAVTDERSTPYKYQASTEGRYRIIRVPIPGAQDTRKTVVISYRVFNGLRYFPDHDELYWNVTGTEWPVGIARASALVHVLPSAAGTVNAIAFTGPYGAQGKAYDLSVRGESVSVATTAPLRFREGLTVAVGWEAGLVGRPTTLMRAKWFVEDNPMVFLPLVVFLGMFGLWYTQGRDPKLGPVMPLYESPEDLRPAEAGTLVDEQVNIRDVSATLVDLAVRGFIDIEEGVGDYSFHRKKPASEWAGLRPYEKTILVGLFDHAGGQREFAELSSYTNRFYSHLPGIHQAIFDELMRRGYFSRRPDRLKAFFMKLGGGVIGGAFLVGTAGATLIPGDGLVNLACTIASGLIILGFGWYMPARTRRGADAYARVLGFEEFLGRTEKDRLARMTPDIFEKFLPFAMAFGVEKHWASAFAPLLKTPPDWYRGMDPSGFNTMVLTDRLNRFSQTAGTVFTSAPRSEGGAGSGWSSSSSGFSDSGGSSGGGSGGGGGDAY